MMPVGFAWLLVLVTLVPIVLGGLLVGVASGALAGRALEQPYRRKLLLRDALSALLGMIIAFIAIIAIFLATSHVATLVADWILLLLGAALVTVVSRVRLSKHGPA